MMSAIIKNYLSPQSDILNHSNHSSIIVSGRCTSTPISSNPSKPLLSDSKCSFNKKGNQNHDSPQFLKSTPECNLESVPIFGRRNLQLLMRSTNERATLASANKAALLKAADEYGDNIKQSLTERTLEVRTSEDSSMKRETRKNTISDAVGEIKKKSVNIETKTLRHHSAKIPTNRKVISLRSSVTSTVKRRRSTHNEVQLPSRKVTLASSKSAKLKTALKGNTQQSRRRISKDKQDLLERNNVESPRKNTEILSTAPKPIAGTIKAGVKKSQRSLMVKNELKVVPECNIKREIKSPSQPDKYDTVKITPFKAHPIRKYSAVEIVKRHKITVPQSPKLSYRRLCSYPR